MFPTIRSPVAQGFLNFCLAEKANNSSLFLSAKGVLWKGKDTLGTKVKGEWEGDSDCDSWGEG